MMNGSSARSEACRLLIAKAGLSQEDYPVFMRAYLADLKNLSPKTDLYDLYVDCTLQHPALSLVMLEKKGLHIRGNVTLLQSHLKQARDKDMQGTAFKVAATDFCLNKIITINDRQGKNASFSKLLHKIIRQYHDMDAAYQQFAKAAAIDQLLKTIGTAEASGDLLYNTLHQEHAKAFLPELQQAVEMAPVSPIMQTTRSHTLNAWGGYCDYFYNLPTRPFSNKCQKLRQAEQSLPDNENIVKSYTACVTAPPENPQSLDFMASGIDLCLAEIQDIVMNRQGYPHVIHLINQCRENTKTMVDQFGDTVRWLGQPATAPDRDLL